MSRIIFGKRPVDEALRHTPERIVKLALADAKRQALKPLAQQAQEHQVMIEWLSRQQLDDLCQTIKHQGVAAVLQNFAYVPLTEFVSREADRPRLVIALDQVTDPQNLGACLRAAGAFGADLMLLTKDRCAPVTTATVKASAGASEVVPVARETNLARALAELKKNDFWIYGLDAEAPQALSATDVQGNVVLVLGSEGSGLRRLVAETCDRLVQLPASGPIASLNVAQACAVALYEVCRLRQI